MIVECRVGCGACCIAPSITSKIPGMPNGKAAGMRCIHLNDHNQCVLFESPDRPDVCISFKASVDICGSNFDEAMKQLSALERLTSGEVQRVICIFCELNQKTQKRGPKSP